MSKSLETERLTERLEVRLSESSYQFLKQQKQQTGKSLSYLVDQMVKRNMNQPTQFLGTETEELLTKIFKELSRLRVIGNENNKLLKVNEVITNYQLMAEAYQKELHFLGGEVVHHAMLQAKKEVREKIVYDECLRINNHKSSQKDTKEKR